MVRRLVWVLVALLAAYLVFIGGGWLGIYTSSIRIITVSLAAIGLLVWALVAVRRPEWRPRSVLLPAILGCLGSLAISTAFSRVPRVSLEYLGYAVMLAALYLLLVRLMANPFFRARLVGFGAVMFVGISLEFIGLVVYLWLGWWQDVGHLGIPPLRPNFIGLSWGNPSAILTIVALFAVPTAARFGSMTRRGIAAFLAIGVMVGVVALLTGSRAGWLALAITGLVGLVVLGASRDRRTALRVALLGGADVRMPMGLRIVLAVGGLVSVIVVLVFLPAIAERAGAGGEALRSGFFAVALRMFATSPLVGTGPGTWVIQRPAFTHADETDYYIPHAHDVPVQVLAESGLVGAVAGAILIASLAWLIWTSTRSADVDRRRWAWISGLGLLYFGLHNLLDNYSIMPAILFAAALPIAYLDATSEAAPALAGRRFPTSGGRLALIAGTAIVLVSSVGLLVQEIPAQAFDRAVGAANQRQWSEALAPARAAADSDPAISPYTMIAGLAAAHVGDDTTAAAYLARVTDQDDLPEAWLDLAAEQALLGRNQDASASLQRAMRLGLQRTEVALPAGELAMRLGLADLATQAFARAIDGNPSLAGDPWWQADPRRAAMFPGILKAALEGAGTEQWLIALMAGDLNSAAALTASSTDPDGNARVVKAWAGDSAAFQSLLEHCSAQPLDLTAVLWCARIEDRAGDSLSAERYRSEAEAISVGASASSLDLRVVNSDRDEKFLRPFGAYWWAIYTYRRWGPIDIFVPSLIHVQLE